MTWREVLLTLWGIYQRDEGIRRAAYLIHCSLVDKKHRENIHKIWPLPFDNYKDEHLSTIERLKQRQLQLKNKHGNSGTA